MPMLSRSPDVPTRTTKTVHYLMAGSNAGGRKHLNWSLCGFPFDVKAARRAWGDKLPTCRRCVQYLERNTSVMNAKNSAHLQRDGGS